GHMLTFVGLHHSTGQVFKWEGGMPQVYGPSHATLVTPDALKRCIDRLASELTFYLPPRARMSDVEIDDTFDGDMRVPHLAAWADGSWIEQDGKIFDGREAFLWKLVKEAVKR